MAGNVAGPFASREELADPSRKAGPWLHSFARSVGRFVQLTFDLETWCAQQHSSMEVYTG